MIYEWIMTSLVAISYFMAGFFFGMIYMAKRYAIRALKEEK